MSQSDIWKDPKGIPFTDVVAALHRMRYASTCRVMFLCLAFTGCRISELDRMRLSNLKGEIIRWPLGKNQTGWRKERLPLTYLNELRTYRDTHRVYADRFFGVDHNTFRSYFIRKIRPMLGPKWMAKTETNGQAGARKTAFNYNLKGLRKNFLTLDFKNNLIEHNDAYVAMLCTSHRAHHKSLRVTAFHYIQEFSHLDIDRYAGMTIHQVLASCSAQQALTDYLT